MICLFVLTSWHCQYSQILLHSFTNFCPWGRSWQQTDFVWWWLFRIFLKVYKLKIFHDKVKVVATLAQFMVLPSPMWRESTQCVIYMVTDRPSQKRIWSQNSWRRWILAWWKPGTSLLLQLSGPWSLGPSGFLLVWTSNDSWAPVWQRATRFQTAWQQLSTQEWGR